MPKLVHHDGEQLGLAGRDVAGATIKPVGQAVNFQFLPTRPPARSHAGNGLSAHVTVNPSSAPFVFASSAGIEHAIEIQVLSGTRTEFESRSSLLRWPPRRITWAIEIGGDVGDPRSDGSVQIGNRARRHAIGARFKPVWDGRANETVSKVLYNVAIPI